MTHIQAIRRISAIAAAAALVATAVVPAGAATFDPVREVPAKVAKRTRYCVVDGVTGSRIARKTCKTRDEWIKADGFDPIRHR